MIEANQSIRMVECYVYLWFVLILAPLSGGMGLFFEEEDDNVFFMIILIFDNETIEHVFCDII